MDNKIQLTQEKDIVYSSFKLHKNGLSAIGTPTFEQWQECGGFIRKAEGSVHFWIGDWLNYGEQKYGEKYTQAIDETNFSYQTLKNDAYVAKQIDLSRRRDDVSWGIHAEIAPFEPAEQDRLLDKAVNTKMTIQQLRKEKHRLLLEDVRPITTTDPNLIHGDCLTELLKLPDNSIDCLITDPPYGIDYQSNHRTATPEFEKIKNDQDQALYLLGQSLEIISHKIKTNSHLYIFCSWKNYPEFKKVVETYFNIKNLLVWEKNNWSMGDLEGNYAEQYELIIFAEKGRRILFGGRDTNILHYDRVGTLIHPTEKPISLLEHLIEKSTKEDEVVLDPFMGSGSTCLAAKNKHRKYIGIELDKQWFDAAQGRINEKLG